MAKKKNMNMDQGRYYGAPDQMDGVFVDYTKHANVPDHVIVKDMDIRDQGGNKLYDDSVRGMNEQFSSLRRDVNRNHPKSRY